MADVGFGVAGKSGVAAVGRLAVGGMAPTVPADVVTATSEPSVAAVGRLAVGGAESNGVADVGFGVAGKSGVAAVGRLAVGG
ncbi:hypothetical protein ACFC0R_21290, partial [Streptomyces sp. NPDC056086]|uniref:hypothetical protein n=1 Tax=Streptomyces sp. NPDC056086 TaxID=3345709 RepID=UPI0035DC9370